MDQVPNSGTSQLRSGVRPGATLSMLRPTPLRIAFFGHDSTESTIIKRAEAFQNGGARVVGFMFRRLHDKIALAPSWTNVALGATHDGRYLRRVAQLFTALPVVIRNRALLREADVIYARNADMLALAVMSRWLTRAKAPIVYEALDVQPAFIGSSVVNRVLRFLERQLLSATKLLVVSSPAFVSRYFEPLQHYARDWHLLENKVVLKAAPDEKLKLHHNSKRTKPWVIGWFGVIRCQRSLEILEALAAQFPDDVRVHIRGLPSVTHGITSELLKSVSARQSNIEYLGPYNSPKDLAHIYGAVDIVWAIDFSAAGSNSDWLIPNRLYEGGLYGVPALARADTATGDIVARDGSGWCLAEPFASSLASFIAGLDATTIENVSRHIQAFDRSAFVDETDTRDLLVRLTQIAAAAAGPGRLHSPQPG